MGANAAVGVDLDYVELNSDGSTAVSTAVDTRACD